MASEEILWKAVGGASGVAAGAATRKFLHTAWRKTTGGDPPTNPASRTTTWKEALFWAAASGMALSVARMVSQRAAAGAWKAKTGSYPPGLETVSP
ncbi:MAG: hypothetical protein QOJ69_1847 [Actinomycetota bacterium]|jgi:hypothetical protein|nr:hypothetical protein [Actinomycetota bacterium]